MFYVCIKKTFSLAGRDSNENLSTVNIANIVCFLTVDISASISSIYRYNSNRSIEVKASLGGNRFQLILFRNGSDEFAHDAVR